MDREQAEAIIAGVQWLYIAPDGAVARHDGRWLSHFDILAALEKLPSAEAILQQSILWQSRAEKAEAELAEVMPGLRRVTERERAAFVAGAVWDGDEHSLSELKAEADRRYPDGEAAKTHPTVRPSQYLREWPEVIQMQREAFVEGAKCHAENHDMGWVDGHGWYEPEAARRYPDKNGTDKEAFYGA
jgi:hypothetical protein